MSLNALCKEIHEENQKAGWWTDVKYEEKLNKLMDSGMEYHQAELILTTLGIRRSIINTRNMGEMLCLVHSEISEAMEGHRKGLMDDKLPHRSMLEVELADAIIRICDIAGSKNLDLDGAIAEKRAYNSRRSDHKLENRLKDGGKAY